MLPKDITQSCEIKFRLPKHKQKELVNIAIANKKPQELFSSCGFLLVDDFQIGGSLISIRFFMGSGS